LRDQIVGWPRDQRPLLTESRNAQVDHTRVQSLCDLIADAEAVTDAGAEVLDDDVALGDQFVRNLEPFRRLEVERNAALVAVHQEKQATLTADERTNMPVVVALRRLDLDHVGTDIRQQRRAERPGHDARKVENAYSVEWRRYGHGKLQSH